MDFVSESCENMHFCMFNFTLELSSQAKMHVIISSDIVSIYIWTHFCDKEHNSLFWWYILKYNKALE